MNQHIHEININYILYAFLAENDYQIDISLQFAVQVAIKQVSAGLVVFSKDLFSINILKG